MSELGVARSGLDLRGNGATFLGQICAYFRDFLDSDFRRQRMPKRSVALRDHKGNLTGISVSKYPSLVEDIWKELRKPLDASLRLSLTVGRSKYRGRVHKTLSEIIAKHIAALLDTDMKGLGDRIKSTARELRKEHQNDPQRYLAIVINALQGDLVRTAVAPLILKLEAFFKTEGQDAYETAYSVEDELAARLTSDAEEAIGAALAAAIVENSFSEFDAIIEEVVDPETVRRRLIAYFESFSTSDFFRELHELSSTLKLRENFELYLYIGELRHNSVSYPIFYLPLHVSLEGQLFQIEAAPHLYINKKALDYAAQETARDLGRTPPVLVHDRIVYLQESESFVGRMQALLDGWCAELALAPPLDLSTARDQQARRSQVSVTNAMHFSAFDKSDEALLNDYEDLMGLLNGGAPLAQDFEEIVLSFLSKDPTSVTQDIERGWEDTPIKDRLVFQSPVPLNEEQRKIISALNHQSTRFIAIEGPPGTGKSHTITAIVFDAILSGRNVLVLSDKTEALDVVEDKLDQVLKSVRTDENFQNPILRLGKSGNTYGRILSNQSIEAIRNHHRATSAAASRLEKQIEQDEGRLAGLLDSALENSTKIELPRVVAAVKQQDQVQKTLPDVENILGDELCLAGIEALGRLSEFVSGDEGRVLRIISAVCSQVTIEQLEAFVRLQKPLASAEIWANEQFELFRFFRRFRPENLRPFQDIISAYQAAEWPLLGFLFSSAQARQLDSRLGIELEVVNPLNAHRALRKLEQMHAAMAAMSARLQQHSVSLADQALAFQQAIDGFPPISNQVDALLSDIAQVRRLVENSPNLLDAIGVKLTEVSGWAGASTSTAMSKLKELLRLATSTISLRKAFASLPDFDYAGDKARLERLHAQRLAHTIDSRLIDFADNHRNLSRAIRDVIRKRQRFPKEEFAALKKAFPCMIAGIRDYAEYVPLEGGIFDVVIIDEASQVSIAQAFPAFVRAKKMVVLGDKKQFSNVKTVNASIETNNQYMNSVINVFQQQFKPDVSTLNKLKLFNIKTSVLDFVERIANYQAMLRKHFRGYPELISFSSKTFYNGQLQAVKIRGKPIEEVLCFTEIAHDGRVELRKNINSLECEAIVAELRRLAEFDDPPSVGVITPFNEQQANILEQVMKVDGGIDIQAKLNLKVMTFDSCQGEERDIVIYSMVATTENDKLAYIFPKSLQEADEVDHILRLQRLNVGFSRAKERIHIYLSQPLAGFRGAIAQALIHYNNQILIAQRRPSKDETESPMEAKVLEWIERTGFYQRLGDAIEISPQFNLGAYLRQLDPAYKHPDYRVDFLLNVNTPKRSVPIVVEYDGFHEHFTNLESVDAVNYADYYRPEDVERQKILEGYGYRFLRINRFNVGKDPVRTLDERLSRLAKDALDEARSPEIVEQVREAVSGLKSGAMKACATCGQVKPIEDFEDAKLKRGVGRKCVQCKEQEAAAREHSSRSGPWGRRRRRRW